MARRLPAHSSGGDAARGDMMEERHADLQARIDAARRHLAEESKNDWAEIGNLLEGLSEELNGHPKGKAEPGVYERIEHTLASIQARLRGAK